jgi:Putative adhesin
MATYVRQQEISHSIGVTGRLDMRVTDGDVRLRGVDGNLARLRVIYEISAGSEEEADQAFEVARLDVEQGDDWLEIRDRQDRDRLGKVIRRLISGKGGIQISIEGEAPAGCQLRLETVSGDLVVEGMRGEQRYTTVSGDLYATELDGTVRLTTVSGDATLRGDTLALWCETVSGDLSAMAPLLSEVRLSSVSGDLELEGALARDGSFRAETVSGDLAVGLLGSASFEVRGISSDVRAEMDHRLEGRMDRRRVVIGDGTPTFVFSSMSGDVLIRRPRRLEQGAVPQHTAPQPPARPGIPQRGAEARDAASLEVLRALERGEIDVDEAARRLAGGPGDA